MLAVKDGKLGTWIFENDKTFLAFPQSLLFFMREGFAKKINIIRAEDKTNSVQSPSKPYVIRFSNVLLTILIPSKEGKDENGFDLCS